MILFRLKQQWHVDGTKGEKDLFEEESAEPGEVFDGKDTLAKKYYDESWKEDASTEKLF